jgi:hypothetical protein
MVAHDNEDVDPYRRYLRTDPVNWRLLKINP